MNSSLSATYLHMSGVFVCTASIGHHIQITLICLSHYQVIYNASFIIGEERQGALETQIRD